MTASKRLVRPVLAVAVAFLACQGPVPVQLVEEEYAFERALSEECDCDASFSLGYPVEPGDSLATAEDSTQLRVSLYFDPYGEGDRGSLCFSDSVGTYLSGVAQRALEVAAPRERYTTADVMMYGSRIDDRMVVEKCLRSAIYDETGDTLRVLSWTP